MPVQSKNLAENLDYEIIICLNQSLVILDWVSGRSYCIDCVHDISWEPFFDGTPFDEAFDEPGYHLWDGLFVTGTWQAKNPELTGTLYDHGGIDHHYQNWLLHPVYQAHYFLQEATSKLYKCHEDLVKDWGIEAFNQIMASFCHVLKLLSDQKIKSHEYGKLSHEGITKKGRCIQRCLFF